MSLSAIREIDSTLSPASLTRLQKERVWADKLLQSPLRKQVNVLAQVLRLTYMADLIIFVAQV
jgi:hypothetical protein